MSPVTIVTIDTNRNIINTEIMLENNYIYIIPEIMT